MAFSNRGEQGLLFIVVCGLLIALASHCEAQALSMWASVVAAWALSSCGTQAWIFHSMWNLPGPGIEPVSTTLAGGFLFTVPPGNSSQAYF